MSAGIPWPLLQNQYSSDHAYQDDIWKMLHSPEEVMLHILLLLFYEVIKFHCIEILI